MMSKDLFDKAPVVDVFADLPQEVRIQNKIKAAVALAVVRARENLGMTQGEFAEYIGTDEKYLLKLAQGECDPTISVVAEILARSGYESDKIFIQIQF